MKNITYKAPKNNKEVFIDHAVDRIPDLAHENQQKMRGFKFEVNGIPFQILREKTREELLSMATNYTAGIQSLLLKRRSETCLYVRDSNQRDASWHKEQDKLPGKGLSRDHETIRDISIIQTGHEPILYYPGVWIKNHLTQHLAKRMGGVGVNMIVDNDACNMGFVYAPILSEDSATVQKVALVDRMDGVAYEEIVFGSPERMLTFKKEILNLLKTDAPDEKKGITFESMRVAFEEFIDRCMNIYYQGCTDMVGLLTTARRALEKDLGIDNLEIPVSWICETDGFYHFLLHIVYEAERFAKIYNEKLSEYRSIHKIRSKANPLPDLRIMGNLIELPFWTWKAGERRGKCYLMKEGTSLKVTNGADDLFVLGNSKEENIERLKALKDAKIKIRPRAITTTMFSRLFFSDVFIHGIGGAKYDTITDEIIAEIFSVAPPAFVTISTTLFLPFDTYNVNTEDLQALQRELTDMNYSPEHYVSGVAQNDREFIDRVNKKKRILEIMEASSKEEKKRYFDQIKALNTMNLNVIYAEIQRKRNEIDAAKIKLAYNEVIKFREYPVCIYPTKLLKEYFYDVFFGE
ncbi:hypothetical protein BIY37_05110 [Candidatus Brocadia sapporoensis]|uniref:Uncharacterized protein n=1 Tax=Candidatus Brocadia sapporoensis TaxID=392547 RepID=A0A1V6M0Z7_9BACT|nr:hypothetical protein [Candidatus Brocadia sapporoensis]MDG6006308.1 hypothetical protein [Candidatus Brocadia sp.]OQD46073.1 hypothetical protein BIY37_05110 [Candidatus Brocadia sapporoensis]GJQ22537.1 MAG: hypothetical protein HBSAPP01_03270 [Candidatus Brocadia sapporoensis]